MRDNESTMKCNVCYWPKDLCECCISHGSINEANYANNTLPVTAQEREQPEREQ